MLDVYNVSIHPYTVENARGKVFAEEPDIVPHCIVKPVDDSRAQPLVPLEIVQGYTF